MDRLDLTGKVSKKLVHLLRWTNFLVGPVGILVEWIAPLDSYLNLSTTATSLQREPLSPVPKVVVVEGFNCIRKRCSMLRGLFCCCCFVFCFI